MRVINVGVIGWGFMGRIHTQALKSIPVFYSNPGFEIKLKCVCTRRPEAAEEAMRSCGFERCCTDYRDLLRMEDIDVVSICTPNDRHEEMAVAAMKAGKHVYIDKPLSVTEEEALRIAAAAKASGVKTRTVLHCRYYPAVIRAKQLIEEGRIGRVTQFEFRYLHSGSVDPAMKVGWKQSSQGGALLDMGSHVLDLAVFLLGMPEKVLLRTQKLYEERPAGEGGMTRDLGDDRALALLEMKDGALGIAEASKIATGTNDDLMIEIMGDRGSLRWSLMDGNFLEFYDAAAPASPVGGLRGWTRIETVGRFPCGEGTVLIPKNPVGWERGHTHCYYTFLREIAFDLPCECSVEEGAKLQTLMARLQQSEKEDGWVSV